MKRTIPLWLGLLAFALLPALAQKPTGKIHGHVTNPAGTAQDTGNVSLSTDGGHTLKYTFPVSATGDYAGEAPAGTYMVIFRALDTPEGKAVDSFDNVKIVAGQDVVQDLDMSRKEYLDKYLNAEQKRHLEELKRQNSKDNEVIKNLNADIKTVNQDFTDAAGAHAAAKLALGDAASKDDLDAKELEIKTAKFTDAETIMQRDTMAKPDASVLWNELALAEVGLAKAKNDQSMYDDAETNFKKALSVEAVATKPNPGSQGTAESGLGEIYARTGKVPEAVAAFDAAAKFNPSAAATYFTNEAALFVNAGNGDAAAAAADEAITADPKQALPYYLKGQGLIQKAAIDPATGKMILPPGCAEAYQKYLDLAAPPNDKFVADVKGILAEAAQVHKSTYGDDTSKKKKGK
ncbi:MAG: carboxypeptidase-like regulatory domain-containing protein [Terracidiphilus sp.]|jgi:tetratricopeptide (TPR) repeat protein